MSRHVPPAAAFYLALSECHVYKLPSKDFRSSQSVSNIENRKQRGRFGGMSATLAHIYQKRVASRGTTRDSLDNAQEVPSFISGISTGPSLIPCVLAQLQVRVCSTPQLWLESTANHSPYNFQDLKSPRLQVGADFVYTNAPLSLIPVV